jgi:hypothetical protein
MNTKKKVTLLWGLPGSGKSHYASEQQRDKDYSNVIDCDKISKQTKPDKMYNMVATNVVQKLRYRNHAIVDGLITTNEVADKIFKAITTHSKDESFSLEFEIVWWTPDIEACLHNDRGRRDQDSGITIQNIAFEKPSKDLIKTWNVKVIRKEIVLKPLWKVWAEESGAGGSDKLESNRWCLGGTSGNCWGPEKYNVSPTPQPASFKEFDELLEQICPQITFLQYKKLYNETVTTESMGDSDYYGGHVEYAKYVCDLPRLYDLLEQMGVLEKRHDFI